MRSRKVSTPPERFIETAALLQKEMGLGIFVTHVQHDSKCSCSEGMWSCTCETVWVQLERKDTAKQFSKAFKHKG